MSQTFTTIGGARVGWTNATWPLAQLSAATDNLTISVFLLGSYSFTPEQVSAVERYSMAPGWAWGIQIRHCRTDCPERIIFWCFGSPDRLLRRIRDAGFVPAASSSEVSEIHRGRGTAVRWSAIVLAVAIWNALLLLDFAVFATGHLQLGPCSLVAVLLAFLGSVGTLRSPRLQRLVMKPGRSVGEIRPFLRLLAVVSGMMLVPLSILVAWRGLT